MKRILIRGLIALVALVALAGLIGLTLDPMVHADISVDIASPPEKVYALIADIESLPKWSSEPAMQLERVSEQPRKYKVKISGMESTWEVIEEQPARLFRSRMESHTMGISGDWRTAIQPLGGSGSQIHHQVAMRFGNPWMRVMGHVMDMNKEEAKTLGELKRYLEAH